MVDDQQVFEAARQGYVEGATEDPKWIRIYQESVDKVLASLTDREQAKLLGYIGQFTSRAAVRIVREMVNVYALLLDEPDDIYKQESARKSLEEFRQDYISGSVGQEEGKRSSDAPHTVYQAAIRRLWASERPYFRQRLTGRIDQALNSFSDVERQAVLNFFESCPVVAVESIVLRWAWVDDEQTRSSFVRQQAEGWKAQGDDAPWFDWPSREDPLWRPVSNSSKRVFEQALDRYLVNRTRPMPGMRMHTRFEIGRALEAFSGVEREQVLACFDKYSVEQIEQVVDQWSYGMIAGFPDYFREQYQKWTSTGDDTVWFPETDRFSLSQVPPTAEDTVVEALLLSGQKNGVVPQNLTPDQEQQWREKIRAGVRNSDPVVKSRTDTEIQSYLRTEGENILRTLVVGVDNTLRRKFGMEPREVAPEQWQKPEAEPQARTDVERDQAKVDHKNWRRDELRKYREENIPYEGYDVARCEHFSVWEKDWQDAKSLLCIWRYWRHTRSTSKTSRILLHKKRLYPGFSTVKL